MYYALLLNIWQISKRKICIVLASDKTSSNFLLCWEFSSRAGGQGKRRATDTTCRGMLSGGRGKAEECLMHASPQQPMAGSQHGLVFQILTFAPFQDPHGHSSSGAQCNAQNQSLPLLSQRSGTNKTRGENSQVFQACSSPKLSCGKEAEQPARWEARAPYPARSDNATPTKHPPVLFLLPVNTGHEVDCQLLCGFSTPASITSLLLQVYKNAYKYCSSRKELGGVKPHVYTKCFSSFRSYFLLHLALY